MAWSMKCAVVALAAAAAVVAVVPTPRALAYPEPSMVTLSWELDAKFGLPERLIVGGKTYWYVRYTVTNNTGKAVLFTPEFQFLSDTGQVVDGNRGVKREIFEKIKALYANPLMLSPFDVFGPILQGEDNAKDSVVIFAGVEGDTRTVRLCVSGLSGETTEVPDPVTGKIVVLHKTLVLDYDLPGEQIGIDPQPRLKYKHWVMK